MTYVVNDQFKDLIHHLKGEFLLTKLTDTSWQEFGYYPDFNQKILKCYKPTVGLLERAIPYSKRKVFAIKPFFKYQKVHLKSQVYTQVILSWNTLLHFRNTVPELVHGCWLFVIRYAAVLLHTTFHKRPRLGKSYCFHWKSLKSFFFVCFYLYFFVIAHSNLIWVPWNAARY